MAGEFYQSLNSFTTNLELKYDMRRRRQREGEQALLVDVDDIYPGLPAAMLGLFGKAAAVHGNASLSQSCRLWCGQIPAWAARVIWWPSGLPCLPAMRAVMRSSFN